MDSCKPHPSNVPGDFYVEDGCCTSCGMPMTEAADLFAYADDGHCYVSKQPANGAEVYRMIRAFEVQDLGCIRYKGTNRVIQIKLVAAGEAAQCDHLSSDLAALGREVAADRAGLGTIAAAPAEQSPQPYGQQVSTQAKHAWWKFWA